MGGVYDFSFSGLKSAVLNYLNGCRMKGLEINQADVAASFQQAVTDVLVGHAENAIDEFKMDKFAIAGGVASNGLQPVISSIPTTYRGWLTISANSSTTANSLIIRRLHFQTDGIQDSTDDETVALFHIHRGKFLVAGKHSLRWVAIDETHSYTGAGAAELAMLLRRF